MKVNAIISSCLKAATQALITMLKEETYAMHHDKGCVCVVESGKIYHYGGHVYVSAVYKPQTCRFHKLGEETEFLFHLANGGQLLFVDFARAGNEPAIMGKITKHCLHNGIAAKLYRLRTTSEQMPARREFFA